MPSLKLLTSLVCSTLVIVSSAAAAEPETFDVVVYGGTSGGVAAAVQTARLGKSVVLIEPTKHIGGLTSGGLGATDIGNKAAIGGISREFYQRIHKHYQQSDSWRQQTPAEYQKLRNRNSPNENTMWTFEPHVAEAIYRAMLKEAGVTLVEGERLDLKSAVKKAGNKIEAIAMESGRTFAGRMFVDCTYEGDLMAKAGVKYHVGREANSVYGETINGVQFGQPHHQFKVKVDPYVKPGDPSSGLLPGVHGESPGVHGEGDHRVQAYNFRMCLTDAKDNLVPFPKPAGYDPLRYELALRTIQAGQWDGLGAPAAMPNRKTDTNNRGAFSSDNIGMNYRYPDGDYATRAAIWKEHEQYQQGWCWFLANDPRVPQEIRDEVNKWGLSKDEFTDNGHWPHQLYVREARRMISDYVMTEHNCRGDRTVTDSVGLAAYTMDSHNTQRFVKDGYALNEGDVQVGGFSPYGISYKSLVPRREECGNLFVPVCLAASHIAYGSIRMEPVFMVLGQSSATAAVQALEAGGDVQDVDYAKLRERLLADQQVLDWTGPKPYRGQSAAELPGLVLDSEAITNRGDFGTGWVDGHTTPGYVGKNYLHDDNADKGQKRFVFTLPLKEAGKYEVRVAYTAHGNRATNVPVTVAAADGEHRFVVNQKKKPAGDGLFHKLDVLDFTPDKPAVITIETKGTDGYVIVDAVQLLPVK
ncbi:MAG: FAD-dependent oxidoreductase [Planctomycetaceae bacterium]|nr:FAD-dependent oxidoreductase [Planctomycetaceae bacterium]